MKSETPAETKAWRALLKECEDRDSPLQMWLLIDSLVAELGKRSINQGKRMR